MAMSRSVTVLLGLLLSSSAFSQTGYPPICYKDASDEREVILLGAYHFSRYQPRQNGVLEKLIDQSDFVLFENIELLPEDGVFKEKKELPEEAKMPIRLDRFVEVQDIPKLSQLFKVEFTPETSIPLAIVVVFVESILEKKKSQTKNSSEPPKGNPFSQIANSYNVESAAYAYALKNKVNVHSLETVSEMFSLPELLIIKKGIGELIECTWSKKCMDSHITSNDKFMKCQLPNSTCSYDEIFHLVVESPGVARMIMNPRNERMAHRLLTFLSNKKKALVIVGAAHIGGPIGLAAKLESVGFVKVKCKP